MLITWFSFAAAMWATARVLPGFELSGGLKGSLVVAALFGVLNWAFGELSYFVVGVLTLGVGFLLSTVTHWFVNVVLLMVTDSFSNQLKIRGFGTAAIAALGISFFGGVARWILLALTR